MAGPGVAPPSIALRGPQTARGGLAWPSPGAWRARIETWLEAERDQIGLWLPVALGIGISLYFGLGDRPAWISALALLGGVGAGALALGRGGRAGRMLAWGALVAAAGLALAWGRSAQVAAPVLTRPGVVDLRGTIVAVDRLPAREQVRLLVAPDAALGLPPQVRVSVADKDAPAGLAVGAGVSLRARLVPPPQAAVPGAYDFARVAWFRRIGATGKALGPATLTAPPRRSGFWQWLEVERGVLPAISRAGCPAASVGSRRRS